MNKKKLSLMLAGIMIVSSIALVGCGKDKAEDGAETPGTEQGSGQAEEQGTKVYTYTLEGEKGNTVVTLTYENGKAVDGTIDVITADGSKQKLSQEGKYVMKEGEEHPWHEQADMIVAFLKENNFDLSKVTVDAEKKTTDAVTGVTIKVNDYLTAFENLMKEVEAGTAKEYVEPTVYTYTLEGEKGDTVVTMTYEGETPVDATIDVLTADGSKQELSQAGKYVMKEGEEHPWHEQANMLVAFLKENNFDLSKVTVDAEKKTTDAVTGVSIKVNDYLTAIENLMKEVEAGTAKKAE